MISESMTAPAPILTALILGPPEHIDVATLAFCATIAPAPPRYVRVEPHAEARRSYCFDNTATWVARHGGSVAYGWAVWRWPGRYFEAEHHGIWRAPDGTLIDVSPQLDPGGRILFVPDDDAVFDPAAWRRNVMGAEDGNAAAAEYIALADQRDDIIAAYKPVDWEMPLLSPEDTARVSSLDLRLAELLGEMHRQ